MGVNSNKDEGNTRGQWYFGSVHEGHRPLEGGQFCLGGYGTDRIKSEKETKISSYQVETDPKEIEQ